MAGEVERCEHHRQKAEDAAQTMVAIIRRIEKRRQTRLMKCHALRLAAIGDSGMARAALSRLHPPSRGSWG